MSWSIRELTEADLDAIARIERSAHQAPLSPDALTAEMRAPCARSFGVDSPEQGLIAFVIAWLVVDELTIMNVATDASHQRQGIARVLLESTLRWAQAQGAAVALLEVRVSNVAARGLYTSMGFEQIGHRRGYYADGEDAIVMQRALDEPAALSDL